MQDQFPGSWLAWIKPSSHNHQTDPKISKHVLGILCKKFYLQGHYKKTKELSVFLTDLHLSTEIEIHSALDLQLI